MTIAADEKATATPAVQVKVTVDPPRVLPFAALTVAARTLAAPDAAVGGKLRYLNDAWAAREAAVLP